MIKCDKFCIPCCDFCIHVYHEYFEYNIDGYVNGYVRGSPIGCIIHYDEHHQQLAKHCGYCEDYYCYKQYKKDMRIENDSI